MLDSKKEFDAFEVGPKRGEELSLGIRKLCGKGVNLIINIPKNNTESWGLREGEMVEIKIRRTGIIKPKILGRGNPAFKEAYQKIKEEKQRLMENISSG